MKGNSNMCAGGTSVKTGDRGKGRKLVDWSAALRLVSTRGRIRRMSRERWSRG